MSFTRYCDNKGSEDERKNVFALVDAAFQQRRKTLNAALKNRVPQSAYEIAKIDPTRRGETLTCDEFFALAKAASYTQVALGHA